MMTIDDGGLDQRSNLADIIREQFCHDDQFSMHHLFVFKLREV